MSGCGYIHGRNSATMHKSATESPWVNWKNQSIGLINQLLTLTAQTCKFIRSIASSLTAVANNKLGEN